MQRRLVAAVIGTVALLLVGCGGEAAPPDEDAASASQAEGVVIGVRSTSLGEVLVDGDGMTLYLFTKDRPNVSTCEGSCAHTWPPVEATSEPSGDGVDQAKLATLDRGDGSKQVSYGGMPLYRYAADERPGDVRGQGVGGVWYVVGADGAAIKASPTSVGGY